MVSCEGPHGKAGRGGDGEGLSKSKEEMGKARGVMFCLSPASLFLFVFRARFRFPSYLSSANWYSQWPCLSVSRSPSPPPPSRCASEPGFQRLPDASSFPSHSPFPCMHTQEQDGRACHGNVARHRERAGTSVRQALAMAWQPAGSVDHGRHQRSATGRTSGAGSASSGHRCKSWRH